MWRFIRQQNIDRYRKQIAETADPFRRARLQVLLEEELGEVPPPTNRASMPDEPVSGEAPPRKSD